MYFQCANFTNDFICLFFPVAPEIDKTILRAASGENERGRLLCRAQAAPPPKFVWTYSGQNLNVNKTWKYNVELKQIDPLTYESTLLIEKVGKNDYGNYECMARNELGSSKENVRLDVTSKPDPPLSLNILNTTHDSVTLAWTPGFDGGMKASYRVRYREYDSEHYKYEDGLPNSHKLTITGLKMNTVYLFSVMASNQLGNSNYLPDLTKAQTKGNILTVQCTHSFTYIYNINRYKFGNYDNDWPCQFFRCWPFAFEALPHANAGGAHHSKCMASIGSTAMNKMQFVLIN